MTKQATTFYEMGREAFLAGLPRIPDRNPALRAAIKEVALAKIPNLLRKYNSGYTDAHIENLHRSLA